jgi:hypothetical protein
MSNISMIIDLSDDVMLEKSHTRKAVDLKWFESVNGNIILYCRICRICNGTTAFAKGTSSLRLGRIKEHMKTN